MKPIETVTEMKCPNCGRYNSGLKQNGRTKMVCPSCGCSSVSVEKSRHKVQILVFAPKPGRVPAGVKGTLFPELYDSSAPAEPENPGKPGKTENPGKTGKPGNPGKAGAPESC